MRGIIFTILVATLALASCAKDESLGSVDNWEGQVRLLSSITTRTVGNSWAEGDKIGVYMNIADGDFGALGKNVLYTITGNEGDYSGGNFSSTTPLYYPESGKVDLLAYYPQNALTTDAGLYPVSVATQGNQGAIDLLVATVEDQAKTSQSLNLVFYHKLSSIALTIGEGDGLSESDLEGVTVVLSGLGDTANYNITTDEITNLSTANNITLLTNTTGTSSEAIVIPQKDVTAKLNFTTKSHGTMSATLPTTEFKVGTQYIYTVKLNAGGTVNITETNITSWGNPITDSGTSDWADPDIELRGEVYYINTGKGLRAFADLVNGKTNTNGAITSGPIKFYDDGTDQRTINGVLTQNISLEDVCGEDIGNWTPIGENAHRYKGVFDGRGYLISDIYVDASVSQDGLFGYTDTSAIICNVGVSGGITCSNSGDTSWEIGGVVGANYGTIINCYNLATISGEANVGGITGHNGGNVVNCYNWGSVTGTSNGDSNDNKNIGGIVGRNDLNVTCCYSKGAISGGTTNTVGSVVGILYTYESNNPTTTCSFGLNTSSTYVIGSTSLAGDSALTEAYMTGTEFTGELNTNAASYNTTNSTANYKACKWIDNLATSGYPTLDFGTVAQ